MHSRKLFSIKHLVITFALLTLSSCAFGNSRERAPYIERAKNVADGLGRTSANPLAEFEACWDMNSECGHAVYFTTTGSIDVVQAKLDALGFTGTQHAETVASQDSTMGSLSLQYGKQLKITGDNPASDSHTPGSFSWIAHNKSGEEALIRIYRLRIWPKTYAFDGKPIIGDVVEVIVRYPYHGT